MQSVCTHSSATETRPCFKRRAPVVWNATFTEPAGFNFSCNTENQPSRMPPAGSVLLRTGVLEAFKAAGKGGVRLRVNLTDADLYSITFQHAPLIQLPP